MMKKYISMVGLLCSLHMLSYSKAYGAFTQPYFYCNEDNAIAVVLPYKEGKCTKTSRDHLKKLAHFAQALNAELIPATTSFKILITTIQGSTSGVTDLTKGVADLTNFSSRLMLLLGKGRQSRFNFAFKPSPDLLSLNNLELFTLAFLRVSTFNFVLYITDEACLNHVQKNISTISHHQLCTRFTSLNPAVELVYSLLHKLGYIKKDGIVKECFSQACNKPSTTSCVKCSSFWYCSSDCNGYKEHVRECKGLILNNNFYRECKKATHVVKRNASGLIQLDGSIEDDLKKFNIKKVELCIEEDNMAHLACTFQEQCKVCKKNTGKKCRQCGTTYYCSVLCQKNDWKEHKNTCNKVSDKRKSHAKKRHYLCKICQVVTDTVVRCPGCKIMFYCSHTCQQHDFGEHSNSCEKLRCIYCEKPLNKLLFCSVCKAVMYCSRECQKSHWKGGHKEICQAPS